MAKSSAKSKGKPAARKPADTKRRTATDGRSAVLPNKASKSRGAKKPAMTSHVDTEHEARLMPMRNDALKLLVTRAMQELRLSAGFGNKSTAWSIDIHTLWAMCCARICDMRNSEEILRDYADEIEAASIPERNVRKFIQRVREICNKLQHEAWEKLASVSKIDATTDPLTRVELLMERVTQVLFVQLEAGELKDGAVGDKHAILRSLELVRDTLEVLATARAKAAQASKIEQQVGAERERISKGGSTGRKASYSKDEVVAMLDDLMLGRRPVQEAA